MSLPTPEELQVLIEELQTIAKSYNPTPDLNGYVSRVQVIAKAKEITRSLVSPDQTPNYHGLNMAELIAIRTFIKLKVLDAIPETGSISLQDLSKATGAQDSLIERMARILVATGFLDQTDPDGGEYKHTKFSKAYLLSTPGPGHLFLAMYDEWFKNTVNFDDYLSDRGQLANAHEPDDPVKNPYTWTHKQDGTPVWGIMAQNPEKIGTFQVGMSGLDVAIPVTGHFDFNLLKTEDDRVELIDVGGGHGECLRQIFEKYPDLDPKKCILQERPDVIDMAKATGKLPEGLVYLAHDFGTEQPIKNAKAYFMRMIMHDYADPVCVNILKQLAKSMAPDSRVLICDMVIPDRVNEITFASAVLDNAVLAMGGKERTEKGFKKLLEEAGMELVEVWRAPGVPGGCVEGRLKA